MKQTILVLAAFIGLSYQQCDPAVCVLPNCRCYDDPKPPGGLEARDTPQIIMVSFQGTINNNNIKHYLPIFEGLKNPNKCPATGTFFIEDSGTDYGLVKDLHAAGHEIGVHSVDGKAPDDAKGWSSMIEKVMDNLKARGIDENEVRGIRAPELACGGDDQFIGMGTNKLLYDSSCVSAAHSGDKSFLWPYTMDYMPTSPCDLGKAPDKPFPGIWEAIVADLHDLDPGNLPCPVPSACRNITTKRDAFDLFFDAFSEHYAGSRTPFLMIVDPAWAANPELRDGTVEFLQYIRAAFGDEVWVVSIHQALQWIQAPVPIADTHDFAPWQCSKETTLRFLGHGKL